MRDWRRLRDEQAQATPREERGSGAGLVATGPSVALPTSASAAGAFERLPPPRTSGASFCPSGLLLAFANVPSPYAGLARGRSRRTACR